MAHENSETFKKGSRWYNRATVGTAKRLLGNPSQRKNGFASEKAAVSAAKQRSDEFKLPKRAPNR